MKSLFKITLAVLLFMVTFIAQGQIFTRTIPRKDSTVNSATKLIVFPSTATGTTGVFLSGQKAASGGGTVSGYALLQIRTDTLPTAPTSTYEDYVYPGTTKRDTLFFTDLTTVQVHTWPVPFGFFNGCRLKVVTSGTQKLYLYAGTIRR